MEKEVIAVADLVIVVRNLIRFITVEGKQFVSEEHKEAYIQQYMQLLISNMNLNQPTVEVSIMDAILEDLLRFKNTPHVTQKRA